MGTSHLIPSRQGRSGEDLIFALDREARTRAAGGESIVNATLGALLHDDGSLAVLETAARAVASVEAVDWAAYAPIEGTPAFREAVIADAWGGHAEAIAHSVAVATPGGTGALRHAIATFLEPGQAFLTPDLFWGPYQTLADEQERRLQAVRMFAARDALDVEALAGALDAQVRAQGRALLILNDPCHNPSGYSMSADDWAGVRDLLRPCAQRGPVTLLLDNAYAAFGPAGAMDTARETLVGVAEEVLVLMAWSASKSFTHYGLRTGALVALVPDDDERAAVEAALATACRGTWGGCTRGGQVAVARLLQETTLRAAVDAERRELAGLLDTRVEAFNRAAGPHLRYPHYQGGFFTTVFCADPLAAAARLREDGVYVVPVPGGLRIGLCAVPASDIERMVDGLRRALDGP